MLNVEYFNHQIIRKYTEVFGTLFNDIVIVNENSDGTKKKTIPVPILHYGNSRNVSLDEKNPMTSNIQTSLPRMSFSMTSMRFSQERATNAINKNIVLTAPNVARYQFAEVPYDMEFELNVYAKTTDDGNQIIEQIVPFFRPAFFPTVIIIPEMDLRYDTMVTLNSVQPNTEFEGGVDDVKRVMWTLNFTMNVFFFGPTSTQGVIKRSIVDLIPVPGSGPVTGDEIDSFGRQQRITITPGLTIDGNPTTNPDESIPIDEINGDDNYGIIKKLEDFDDGKKWNPKTGFDT